MKALILTITAGEGHNSIARAVKNNLESKGVETLTVDMFKGKQIITQLIINEGYIFLCKHFKGVYTSSFHRLQKHDARHRDKGISTKCIEATKKDMYNKIITYAPDVIFCTHMLPARLVIDMAKQYDNIPKSVCVLFDFTVHPAWEKVSEMDYLITSCNEFDDVLIKKGFKKEQFKDFGIPVEKKFSVSLDKTEIRKKLGLEINKTTLMIMNGGVGLGNNAKLVEKLCKLKADFQIILVNGRNKKDKERVDALLEENKLSKKVLNLGFVGNVDELMSAADCIFGKVGGVSVNESLNKKVPIIISNAPPGQEFDNMLYLTKHKAAAYINKKTNAVKIIEELLIHPEKLKEFQNAIEELRKPNACEETTNFLIELMKNYSGSIIAKPDSKVAITIEKARIQKEYKENLKHIKTKKLLVDKNKKRGAKSAKLEKKVNKTNSAKKEKIAKHAKPAKNEKTAKVVKSKTAKPKVPKTKATKTKAPKTKA